MQSRDAGWLALAFIATAPVGFSQPFMGTIMGDTTNTLAAPAVQYDRASGQWVLKPNAIDDIQNSATKLILIFIGIGAVSMLGAVGQNCGFRKSAETLTRYIRSETFKAMLRQEISWFDMRTTGQLAERLASEAPLIKSFTGEQLGGMLQMSIAIGGGIGLALYASWRLTLCNMVFIPLMMVGMAARMRAMRGVNEDTSQAGPLVSEAMGNVRTVAAFGMEEKILMRYDSLLSKETAIARKGSTALSFSTAWSAGMNFFMFGAIVFVANIFINHGWMEATHVMQVLFPIMFCAQGAAMANQWFADKQKAQAAMRHIFHTLDREPLIDAYQQDGLVLQEVRGDICFKHVAFRYPARPDVPVFTDFDLTIPANSTVAFVGPSGSGKSTTIGLLQRFYDPDSGSVCLDGHDLRSLNLAFFRSQMALVQQEPILFGGSILDNIAYGKEGASREEVEKAARSANAHGFIESFPNGYDTSVGERGAQLSGGQKQRVAIARAMIRDPKVLLLDEATSALDSESERVVQQALDELLAQKGRTTLMIAHRLATVVNSDMICVIYDGRIVEKGVHSELMRIPDGHYKQLAARQQADP
jgi:ATP-binding cassette subfamily B (MDR/TAP) protein 1